MRHWLLILFLTACAKNTTPSPAPIASASTVAAPSPPVHYTVSAAVFDGAALSECLDAWADSDAGDPIAKDRERLAKLTPLAKTCELQFADRQPLAICERVRKDGVHVRGAYFDFALVGEDDGEMKECLKFGGDWRAQSKDSRAWKLAELEHLSRKAKSAKP